MLTLLIAGCSGAVIDTTALEQKPLAERAARLKIYRPDKYIANLSDARVKVDGKEIGKIESGGAQVFDVPAGPHVVEVDHWAHVNVFKLEVNTKPGMLYALEITPREDAAVAGALFGVVGSLVEAAANENGGTYQLRLVEEKPIGS